MSAAPTPTALSTAGALAISARPVTLRLDAATIARAAEYGLSQALIEDAALLLDGVEPLDGGYMLRARPGLATRLQRLGLEPVHAKQIALVTLLVDVDGCLLAIDSPHKRPSRGDRWEQAMRANRALAGREAH